MKHFAESVVPIVEAVADGAGMDAVAAGARVVALEAAIVVAGNFADEVDLDAKAVLDMIPDRQNQLDWEECLWAEDARCLTVASQFRIHLSLAHFQRESLPGPAAEIATAAVPSAAAIVATVCASGLRDSLLRLARRQSMPTRPTPETDENQYKVQREYFW